MTMNSTKKAETKPAKPYDRFPLFAHNPGRWCKKIRGRFYYFGPWRDPDGALELYQAQRDDLHAGRKPRAGREGLTVADACNRYLTAKHHKVEAGELQRRTWLEYKVSAEIVVQVFGRDRLVEDLADDDFEELRAILAKGTKVEGRKQRKRGPMALGRQVQQIRCLFRYAYNAGLIDRPVRFGPGFVRPGKDAVRRARKTKPPRLLKAKEIRKLVKTADPQLEAMILLGVNCGLGNTDCAMLQEKHLDLGRGVLDFPRPKTAIERRATLWPETIEAIKAALKVRPKAKHPDDAALVFVTRCGHPWVRYRNTGNVNSVTLQFGKLLRKQGPM